MKITFWGVRGSIPVPGLKTARYGGNTPCIQVTLADGTLIIIDGGSGIRWLGREIMQSDDFAQGRGKGFMLFSHKHWDHIQGLLYFEPSYVPGNQFTVFSSMVGDVTLKESFAAQHGLVYFPVPFEVIESAFHFQAVAPGDAFTISKARVEVVRLNHPGVTIGFVIKEQGKSFAYLCDTAPWQQPLLGDDMGNSGDPERETASYREKVLQAIEGVDLVVHDSFFEPQYYETRKNWGHSTAEQGIELALAAGVNQLVMFHYAPDSTDDVIDRIFLRCRKEYAEKPIIVSPSFEGRVIEL